MSTQCRPKTGHLSNAQAAFRQVEDASVAPNRLPECQVSSPALRFRASLPGNRNRAQTAGSRTPAGLGSRPRRNLPQFRHECVSREIGYLAVVTVNSGR